MAPNAVSKKVNIKLLFFSIISLGLFTLLFIFGGSILENTKECILFCATSLAPSLFPLMCASGILLRSPASSIVGRMIYPFCKRLFGLSQNGSYVWGVGNLCGFPIGAQNAHSLYYDNKISKDELDFLLIFSSTPSSAFVINAIGLNILKNKTIGIRIYICVLLSCIISGIIYRWVYWGKKSFPTYTNVNKKSGGFVHSFCESIRSSALNMMYVCGFVVFFNLLCSVFLMLSEKAKLPQILNIIVSGMLELSNGTKAAGILPFPASILLCAFFVGWSGLSVHLQIFSVCKDVRVSYSKFFLWRGGIGIVCAALCCIAFYFGFI